MRGFHASPFPINEFRSLPSSDKVFCDAMRGSCPKIYLVKYRWSNSTGVITVKVLSPSTGQTGWRRGHLI